MISKGLHVMLTALFLLLILTGISGCGNTAASATEAVASTGNTSVVQRVEAVPADSTEPEVLVQTPEEIELDTIRSAAVGDTITFGTYEQDGDTSDGQENIEWLVLDKDDTRALVISSYGLDVQPFHQELTDVNWQNCSLRSWLNHDFYSTAFSDAEQSYIARTTVVAEDNPDFYTDQGNNTEDRVFLLSDTETEQYFSENDLRDCKPTAFAEAQGAIADGSSGNTLWWLRSSGMSNIVADIVDDDGFIATYEMGGGIVNRNDICIRPAMWIRLTADESTESSQQQNSADLPVLCVPEFRASRLSGSESAFLGTEFLRGQIMTVTFQDNLDGAPADAVDVSELDDGSILLWASECKGPDSDDRAFDTYYNLTIAGDGGILCPESLNSMFAYCDSLSAIQFGDCFDTSCVTDMSGMFSNCSSLTSLDVRSFDTACVTDMNSMFAGCESVAALDLKGFDTSCVTDMSGMFACCESIAAFDLKGFDTACVTDMSWMFWRCAAASEIDVNSFDTSNVTDMSSMFCSCESVSELNLTNFDTGRVKCIEAMFEACGSLQSLDLSGFDTHGVTDMYYMFAGCSSLTILDLSSFDTSNVTGMNDMFYGCSALTALNVSTFDTSGVVDMGYMFRDCTSLTSLNVTNFDTSSAAVMWGMFAGCSSLTDLDTSGFVIGENTDTSGMYDGVPGYNS